MASEISPSLTSTLHTLTSAPPSKMASVTACSLLNGSGQGLATAAMGLLDELGPEKRHRVMRPSASMADDALRVVKETLDAFAAQVGEQQERRLKASRKRKRVGAQGGPVLKLRRLYVDGFETGQVWQQAKKIIGGVLEFSDLVLGELEERKEITFGKGEGSQTLTNGRDGLSAESADEGGLDGKDEDEACGEDNVSDMDEQGPSSEEEGGEGLNVDLDGSDDEEDDNDKNNDSDDVEAQEYVEDPHGLNDGFFSIENFNKKTQWFEEQDVRGEAAVDQAASDDDDIDWGADPFALKENDAKASERKRARGKKRRLSQDVSEEDSDEDEGPTFGNMALDAPEGESEDEAVADDDMDGETELNANEIYYKDFFAPPPQKKKAGKRQKSVKLEVQEPAEADVERAMADVRRDLFDESEDEGLDEVQPDVSAGAASGQRTAHDRRQAKLVEEIRKLEAASVAKREWTLMGEAPAAERPMNSLLEEDLDFEHMGKPVPVITPEVSESIEALIKRRILAHEFDEVLRRRPDMDSVPAGTRRGLVELDDSKPGKSLAQIYEEEQTQRNNPDSYISQADEKLRRDEAEAEAMWKDVCARLDALSSWQYKPKPPAPALFIVADVAAMAMEDAQPGTATAQGLVESASRLAPQEVYRAGAGAALGEVVTRAGLLVARQEMTREERTRRRRREKERARKAEDGVRAGGGSSATKGRRGQETAGAKGRRETLSALMKGGVKVINRRGEVTDIKGNKAQAAKDVTSGSLKL